MKDHKRTACALLILFILSGCVEPYDPPVRDSDINFLVVDGFLNATDENATVTLSRTLPVKSSDDIPVESSASVSIEEENGLRYQLSEERPGYYTGTVPFTTGMRYRLSIRTRDNHEYASDFVDIPQSPPIDSITYSVERGGVQLAVNTHDPSGRARHYRWKYEETHEYHSNYNSIFLFSDEGIIYRLPDQAINICWKTGLSTGIMVGSTKHLQEAVVTKFPLALVPFGSLKLSVKYSILVRQQALTDEAYAYWLNLEKSTEELGGLFDPLPSEVSGNIQSLTHPSEKVIGFFGGSTVTEARRFISRYELPRSIISAFGNSQACVLDTILLADLPNVAGSTLLVDGIYPPGAGLIGYTTSSRNCIDCTTFGGTTVKPTFWK